METWFIIRMPPYDYPLMVRHVDEENVWWDSKGSGPHCPRGKGVKIIETFDVDVNNGECPEFHYTRKYRALDAAVNDDAHGWLSPEGLYFACQYQEHDDLASHLWWARIAASAKDSPNRRVGGFQTFARALETLGWIPVQDGRAKGGLEYERGRLTSPQQRRLERIGTQYRKDHGGREPGYNPDRDANILGQLFDDEGDDEPMSMADAVRMRGPVKPVEAKAPPVEEPTEGLVEVKTKGPYLSASCQLSPVNPHTWVPGEGRGVLDGDDGVVSIKALRYGVGQQHDDGSISVILRAMPFGGKLRLLPAKREGAYDVIGVVTFAYSGASLDHEGADHMPDYLQGYINGTELAPFTEPEGV